MQLCLGSTGCRSGQSWLASTAAARRSPCFARLMWLHDKACQALCAKFAAHTRLVMHTGFAYAPDATEAFLREAQSNGAHVHYSQEAIDFTTDADNQLTGDAFIISLHAFIECTAGKEGRQYACCRAHGRQVCYRSSIFNAQTAN